MVLAVMAATDEDALVCDFAETYHIYDYRGLPLRYAAVLACGLRPDSRIRMKIGGQGYTLDEILLATVADAARMLVWMQSRSGARGVNRPKSILAIMTKKPEEQPVLFDTAEDFERRRQEIIKNGNRAR